MNSLGLNRSKIDVLAVILDVRLTVDNSAVFQSQVVDQLVALNEMGYRVGLLCIYSDKDIFLSDICRQLESQGIQTFYDEDRGLIKNLVVMAVKLRALRKNISITSGYARGIWGALVMILSNPRNVLPYIYDIRGDLSDETKAVGTNSLKAKIYIFLEKIAIAASSKISVVSSALKKKISERMWTTKTIFTIPSCIDYSKFSGYEEEIFLEREKMGFSNNDVVLLYSGGLSYYQKVPEMLELWRKLYADCDDVKFILLTNSDPHSLPSNVMGLEKFGSALQVHSLPREELFSVLCIADIAFLLRDDRDLNRVASPVKFAEYIASGLAVVGSPNIGDVSGDIEYNMLGLLISPSDIYEKYDDLLELIKSFRSKKSTYAARAKSIARRKYDWQSHLETYTEMYGAPTQRAKER